MAVTTQQDEAKHHLKRCAAAAVHDLIWLTLLMLDVQLEMTAMTFGR